jgi:YlqD protein
VQVRRFELERQVTPQQTRNLRAQLELERQRQEATKAELQARLREAQDLELNSEFTQGTIEGMVEVAVGDNLFDKISRTEIIVKDGIVLEIRETSVSPLITPAGR